MENSYEKDLSWIDTHTHLHVKRFDREWENILRWMQENGMRNIEIPIEYRSGCREGKSRDREKCANTVWRMVKNYKV